MTESSINFQAVMVITWYIYNKFFYELVLYNNLDGHTISCTIRVLFYKVVQTSYWQLMNSFVIIALELQFLYDIMSNLSKINL